MIVTREQIRDLAERYEQPITLLEPKKFDTAIIGVSRDAYEDLHVVYDYNKVIDVIAGKDMTEEEAKEFFEYNTQRSLGSMGDNYPIINYTDVEDIP